MAKRKPEGIQHTPYELEIIARADRYVAYLFIGRFNKHKVECETDAEAREVAHRLADEHRRCALIYAIAGAASALLTTIVPARLPVPRLLSSRSRPLKHARPCPTQPETHVRYEEKCRRQWMPADDR